MVDVFEQVEEEMRSERWKRLARQWGPVVGGILALALIAALAFWGYQSWETGRAEKAAVAYDRGLEAMQRNDLAGAEAAFAEAEKVGNAAYKALALNQRAGVAVSQNRIAEAIELLNQAARANGDPLLADQAALKATWLLMDSGGTLEQIEDRLEPLVGDDRPMRVVAMETQAMARLQHGKPAEARQVFVLLQLGQDVPDSVRQRAQVGIAAIDNGTAAALPNIVRAQAAVPVPTLPASGAAAGPQPAPVPVQP